MKKVLIILVALSLLLVCGCSSNISDNKPTVGEAEIIEFGKKEDAKYLLQVDINPSLIVGYAKNENVVYIASNNADGYELLGKHDANKILGEPIHAAVGSLMTAAHEDGYETENFDVSISFIGEEKDDDEIIMQIARQAVETCDFDIKITVEEKNEIVYNAEIGVTETAACNVCRGEGAVTCEDCKGKGERIVIVQREKEVRNDYVCEICGGKGWIDDGMHGGEIGNCDSCGGIEGKNPSGDFRKKAYDLVMVDEEEMRKCDTCNGSGSVVCRKCNGSGTLD